MTRRRVPGGLSLAELLVAMSLFAVISTVTFLSYNHARQTIFRSSARMDSAQRQRHAMQRVSTALSSAYVPPINNVTSPLETPNLPYPPGVNPSDPLSAPGPGCDSIIFYAPCDLITPGAKLYPVTAQTGPYNPASGPKLYEIRLDAVYQNDPAAAYQPDQPSVHGTPPLVMKRLIMREMYIPDHTAPYSRIAYLVTQGGSPQPSIAPQPATPTLVLAQMLSDFRFWMAPAGSGFRVAASSQDREATLNTAQPKTIKTTSLTTYIYYLAGH